MLRRTKRRRPILRLLSFPTLSPQKPVRPPSEGEVLFELAGENPSNRLFGRFDEQDLRSRLARGGILPALAARGYARPDIVLECRDPQEQRVMVYADRRSRDRLLIEARLELRPFRPAREIGPFGVESSLRMLLMHWILLCDPDAAFTPERPRLPGQERPGLGLLRPLLNLLKEFAAELGQDGVLDVPHYYHAALFYSRTFRFLDPDFEGRFVAMRRDLRGVPLALASEAIAEGALRDARSREPVAWSPTEQVMPVGSLLRRYFRSAWYAARRDRAAADTRFVVDWDFYRARLARLGRPGKSP